jgi:uncharacterized protein YdhG (YjbR/CyaY superfamily)
MEAISKTKFRTVDEYLSGFPEGIADRLQNLRNTIKKNAPQAEELISYNIPAFKWQGMLVWYAGYKEHIGFYPGASGIAAFKKELSKYKGAKGSVQFPLDKPLPLGLVAKIVRYRVRENREKGEARATKKKAK